MHISLDCYQILGLPIQATPEQLEPAYQDRQQQQPHHHYSTSTIAARQALLSQAYQLLRNPLARSQYDQAVIAYAHSLKTQPKPEEPPPGISVEDVQFAGALLLLYELGAYHQALELGQQYLSAGTFDLRRPYTGSALAEADILLTVALSYLELGREQWQQGHYEPAAYYLQGGLDVLVSENQFSDVQTQLKTELFRLRPYRVLELVAHPDLDSSERQRGLMLLKDMLLEREGIDGNRDDHSGLGIDDFLKFIQQLRAYLTTTEQQDLFEAEARRPSAVGTYLASYALVARGVSQRQPALIRRAKSMLKRLLPHQDVHLEIASSALLLGQTQEALHALSQTQDKDALAFVQEYSLNSPDLLPGLYHYTDQWLAEEVYPAFRDLGDQPVELDAYFADEQIQAYADALTAETAPSEHLQSTLLKSVQPPITEPTPRPTSPPSESKPDYARPGLPQLTEPPGPSPVSRPTSSFPSLSAPTVPLGAIADLPASLTVPRSNYGEVTEHLSAPPSHLTPDPLDLQTNGHNSNNVELNLSAPQRQHSKTGFKIAHPGRFAAVCSLLGVGVLGLGYGGYALWQRHSNSAWVNQDNSPTPTRSPNLENPVITATSPSPSVTASPTPMPTPASPTPIPTTTPPTTSNEILTTEMAQARIRLWQESKASALGQAYQTEVLAKILAEPALSRWQSTAQTSQAENSYWQFKLEELAVDSLKPLGDDRFEVIARVREAANFYQGGQLQAGASYEDYYRVRYVFIRQGNDWLIREMRVLS